MKKTLHRELKVPFTSQHSDPESFVTILYPSCTETVNINHYNAKDDINFKYLKHVLIKFLTSREYEVNKYFLVIYKLFIY
jgi:golgin subfamily A protein 1